MTDRETHVEALSETPVGLAMPPVGDPGPEDGASCTATTKRGVTCGRTIALTTTPNGPRCPAHVNKAAVRAPVRSIRSPQDAVRLASWASVQMAEGRLGPQQCNAITNAVREWRRSFEAADTARRFEALQALLTAIAANKRVSAAVEEASATDDTLARAFQQWRTNR